MISFNTKKEANSKECISILKQFFETPSIAMSTDPWDKALYIIGKTRFCPLNDKKQIVLQLIHEQPPLNNTVTTVVGNITSVMYNPTIDELIITHLIYDYYSNIWRKATIIFTKYLPTAYDFVKKNKSVSQYKTIKQ